MFCGAMLRFSETDSQGGTICGDCDHLQCRSGYYLTAARSFTLSGDESRLTYPTAPGVAATYSIRADSESNALGIAPSPVNTTLRQCKRNSSGSSPRWFFKKTSCAGPPFKVTGTAWE